MDGDRLRDALGRFEQLLAQLEALAASQEADRFEQAHDRLALLDTQLGGLAWIVQDELTAADGRRRDEKEPRRCVESSVRRPWRRAS